MDITQELLDQLFEQAFGDLRGQPVKAINQDGASVYVTLLPAKEADDTVSTRH